MGFMSKPPAPPIMPLPPAAAHPPVLGSTLTALSNNTQAQRAAMAAGTAGLDQTNATGAQGLVTKPDTAKVKLLGQ